MATNHIKFAWINYVLKIVTYVLKIMICQNELCAVILDVGCGVKL